MCHMDVIASSIVRGVHVPRLPVAYCTAQFGGSSGHSRHWQTEAPCACLCPLTSKNRRACLECVCLSVSIVL